MTANISRALRALVLLLAPAIVLGAAARVASSQGGELPEGSETGAGAPSVPMATGVGEPSLVIVTAGEFSTQQEAAMAAEALSLGDVQGFYVDLAENYRVLGSYERVSPDEVLVQDEHGQPQRIRPPVELRYRPGRPPEDRLLSSGRWILVSAFRTLLGAEQFVEVARAATGRVDFPTLRVLKVGGGYVGLGQEPHPDGTGPLLGPLPNQEQYQT